MSGRLMLMTRGNKITTLFTKESGIINFVICNVMWLSYVI